MDPLTIGAISSALSGVLDIFKTKTQANQLLSQRLNDDKVFAQSKEMLLFQSAIDKQKRQQQTLIIVTVVVILGLLLTIYLKK